MAFNPSISVGASGTLWGLMASLRYERTILSDTELAAEVPAQLRSRHTIRDGKKPVEYVFGNLLEDPVVVSIMIARSAGEAVDPEREQADLGATLDRQVLQDGSKFAGPVIESRLRDRRRLKLEREFPSGIRVSSRFEVTPRDLRRVDLVHRPGLAPPWQAAGERTLLSLPP